MAARWGASAPTAGVKANDDELAVHLLDRRVQRGLAAVRDDGRARGTGRLCERPLGVVGDGAVEVLRLAMSGRFDRSAVDANRVAQALDFAGVLGLDHGYTWLAKSASGRIAASP